MKMSDVGVISWINLSFSSLNPIFLHLAIERGQSNFEQMGRLCLVAMSMVKHLEDVVSLYTLEVKGIV